MRNILHRQTTVPVTHGERS